MKKIRTRFCPDGYVRSTILTDEERDMYLAMPVGITQTNALIRFVTEDDNEKQIFEMTASEFDRIHIEK